MKRKPLNAGMFLMLFVVQFFFSWGSFRLGQQFLNEVTYC